MHMKAMCTQIIFLFLPTQQLTQSKSSFIYTGKSNSLCTVFTFFLSRLQDHQKSECESSFFIKLCEKLQKLKGLSTSMSFTFQISKQRCFFSWLLTCFCDFSGYFYSKLNLKIICQGIPILWIFFQCFYHISYPVLCFLSCDDQMLPCVS